MRSGVAIFPGSNCDRDIIVALKKVTKKIPLKLWHKDKEFPNLDLIVIPVLLCLDTHKACITLCILPAFTCLHYLPSLSSLPSLPSLYSLSSLHSL